MAGRCASSLEAPLYNTPLRVGGLCIVLGVSSLACAFPLLAVRFPILHIPRSVLFAARHFGTGVLIATTFAHLLPTAFASLHDPCLGTFWNETYAPAPGVIAMAAMFFVATAELVFSRRIAGPSVCRGGVVEMPIAGRAPEGSGRECRAEHHVRMESLPRSLTTRSLPAAPFRTIVFATRDEVTQGPSFRGAQQLPRAAEEDGPTDMDDNDMEAAQLAAAKGMSLAQAHQKGVLQVFLLELGILFHSIFIGMALSVTHEQDFVILLIAIVFHQLFEGLALGSRIAVLRWDKGTWKPWLMALAYGCTTPIGQAIGLATHTLYSPDSEVGLLMVGIMNAISSGLLIWASLVELLAEDFLGPHAQTALGSGKRTCVAGLFVLSGAFCMSLVGAWA